MKLYDNDIVTLTDWIPGLEGDMMFRPGLSGEVLAVLPTRPVAVVHFHGRPGTWHVPFNHLELR